MVTVPFRKSDDVGGGEPAGPMLEPQYMLMASAMAYKDDAYRAPPSVDPESTIPAGRNTSVGRQNPRVQPSSPGGPADIIQDRFPEPRNINDLTRDRPPTPGSTPIQPGKRERFGDPSKVISQAEGTQVAGGPEDIWRSIYQQESGSGRNPSTSSTGAIGPGQIMPGTFREFAKPGENIHNPEDNVRVAKRIVQTYHDRYGGDPARVAVAYFSGPGNVAPAGSPTPWKRNLSDGSVSVAQYVSQVTGRMGQGSGVDIAVRPGGSTRTAAQSSGPQHLSAVIGEPDEFLAKHGEDSMKRVAEMRQELETFSKSLKERQRKRQEETA